jgi:hypothetical protein
MGKMMQGPAERRVVSPYMPNVSAAVLDVQRRVFAKLGIPLEQAVFRGVEHGDWLDDFARTTQDRIIAVADVDAFPLTCDAFESAHATARGGGFFGLAQVANHKDPDDIYAGPMFMTLATSTYHRLGAPSLKRTGSFDAAQALTAAAREAGVEPDLAYPNAAIRPLWPLSRVGVFGIGTFYGNNGFFHLFQSRKSRHIALFEAVAEDVIEDRKPDFARYLSVMRDETPTLRDRLRRLVG